MSKNRLTLPVFGKKSVCFRLGGSFQGPRTLFCRCPTHQNSFRTMFGMIFQLQNKSLHHFLSFRNKLTLFPLKTYVMYRGVSPVPSYTALVGRGRGGGSPAPSTNTVISPTSNSSSGGCRRWSAASSPDTPLGYVARAWFRYGSASPQQRVLRACSRARVLLWRTLRPSAVGCPPWTGADLTGWTCATPPSARIGLAQGLSAPTGQGTRSGASPDAA